ncbi:MAG: MarR family transcriptional regulator [Clostridiaceae bacterium]|nr:MarR family transcriptional regulator [Clostridiaceae bacterium]
MMKYISKLSRLAILYRGDKLSAFGLNAHQHIYIITICNNPGISQDKLAEEIFVNKSNVARQIAMLCENGFVTKKVSEADKRQCEIYPTQKAIDIYPQVIEVLREWNRIIFKDFTDDEKEIFKNLIEKALSNALQNYKERRHQWLN